MKCHYFLYLAMSDLSAKYKFHKHLVLIITMSKCKIIHKILFFCIMTTSQIYAKNENLMNVKCIAVFQSSHSLLLTAVMKVKLVQISNTVGIYDENVIQLFKFIFSGWTSDLKKSRNSNYKPWQLWYKLCVHLLIFVWCFSSEMWWILCVCSIQRK